jgi:hypothetical protein
MDRKAAAVYVGHWVEENMAAEDRERFREMAEASCSACTKEITRATR